MGAAVVFEDSRERSHLNWQRTHRRSRIVSSLDGRLQLVNSQGNENRRYHAPVIDMRSVGGRETFVVDVFDDPRAAVKVVDIRPKERHLLLMVIDGETGEKAKYLMGHDERHWFAAAVSESAHAKNVADAMDALKPTRILTKQAKAGVKAKDRNRRKNDAYIRQGEWFFIPAPLFEQGACVIHKDEPIQRGRGKPHICQDLIRKGGSLVWVHSKWAPNGVNETQANAIRKRNGIRGRDDLADWTQRVADAVVYVRGYVKHPDHKTIHLKVWHRVLPNMENKARATGFLRFLD
jgi:hypothetical protein